MQTRPLPGLLQSALDGPEKFVDSEFALLIGERKGKFELCILRSDWLKIEMENDMETRVIRIRVSTEAAQAYETANEVEQRKLNALLSLKLSDVGRAEKPLEVVMSEISRKARERGMTPEILESILNEQ